MASVTANGITIEYEATGNAEDPALLLIMGLGAQLVAWDPEFVKALASRGFYVVSYDNRDIGLSTGFDSAGVPDLASALTTGSMPPPAYLLSDMADDAAGLLDALGIKSAHVLGVSMGGMISQSLAIEHPEKVLTLTSIMSTTGDPTVGQPHPEAIAALMAPPPADRASAIEGALTGWRIIGSPGFPFREDRIKEMAGQSFDRAFHPEGTTRQMVAIVSSPDRTAGLHGVAQPTLVMHGEADPLVDPSGGKATAEAIPGAELWTVPGMGHDLPVELFDEIADRVAALATKAA